MEERNPLSSRVMAQASHPLVSWLCRDTGNLRLCRLIAEDIEQEAEPPKERDSLKPSHEDIESYGIRLLKVCKNPHPKGWGYTDEARLRGLKAKTYFDQPDLVSRGY